MISKCKLEAQGHGPKSNSALVCALGADVSVFRSDLGCRMGECLKAR